MKTKNTNGLPYSIATLKRFKNGVPFSQRLNDFIIDRVRSLNYEVGSYPEMTFEAFKKHSIENGFMQISNENCENNIFGSVEVNIMFRAWHDAIHLELDEDFDYMSEARVAFYQCAELPEDWHFEKNLILCEVVAQASYHQKYGDFIPNQRKFTVDLLDNGLI